MKIKVETMRKVEKIDLKKLRNEAGLSLRALSVKTGIGFTYLSKLENGIADQMKKETWDKIKKALKYEG